MRSSRLMLLQGSLIALGTDFNNYTPDLRSVGISKPNFDLTVGPKHWRAAEVEIARGVLDGFLSLAFRLSGVGRFSVTGEYLACLIACTVDPSNWMVASQLVAGGLDGVKLLEPGGDSVDAIEIISPARLYSLVLIACDLRATTYDAQEAILDHEQLTTKVVPTAKGKK